MKKKFLLLPLAFFLLPFLSCDSKPKLDPATAAQIKELQKTAGDLAITFFSPKGPATAPQNVTVSFNQPMVPLSAPGEVVKQTPVEITPALPGRFRWLGSKTLVFHPDHGFPGATQFTVTVAKTAESLLGRALGKDFSWQFETPKPQVAQILPGAMEQWVALDRKIFVRFNQKVAPANVQAYATLIGSFAEGRATSGGTQEIDFKARALTAEEVAKSFPGYQDTVVALEPHGPWPKAAKITLEISGKFTGAEGSLPMGQNYQSSFNTYGDFTVGDLACTEACQPTQGIRLALSNPVAEEEFLKKVKILPAPSQLGSVYWDSYDKKMALYPVLEAQTPYQIILPEDLTDKFGQKLGQKVEKQFATTSFAPALNFNTDYGVIESAGPKQYYARLTNVDSLTAATKLLSPDEVVAAVNESWMYNNRNDILSPMGLVRSWEVAYKKQQDKRQHVVIPLKESLSSSGTGLVLLQVTSPQIKYQDWNTKAWHPEYLKALLQVTNLGLTAKWSAQKTPVWVTSLDHGEAVAGVQLEVRNLQNAVLWHGSTDASGMAAGPGLDELWQKSNPGKERAEEEEYESPTYLLFATKGDDQAYTLNGWDRGFASWEFGIWQDWFARSQEWRAHIFTERGVYRPGEVVHIKGILREETDGPLKIAKGSGKLAVNNPKGEQIFESAVTLSENGTLAADVPLGSEARLGPYSITFFPDDDSLPVAGGGNFSVEWFRTPEFEVKTKIAKENYLQGETLEATIKGDYLFGAPMRGRGGDWMLIKDKTSFVPPDQPEGFAWGPYVFFDDWYGASASGAETVAEDEVTLNDAGQATASLELKDTETIHPYRYVFEGTVADVNRQTQSHRSSAIVHPSEVNIGLKLADYFVEVAKGFKVALRVVDLAGKPQHGKNIAAVFKRVTWNTVKKQGMGGGFEYEVERQTKDVATCTVMSAATEPTCDFTPQESGMYLVEATTQDSSGRRAVSSTVVYVFGGGYGGWLWDDSDRIKLVLDKKSYKPGDVARVLVQNPYPDAKALISYERGSVLKTEVVTLHGGSPTLEIPITSDHVPNFYFSVVVVRGRVSEEMNDKGEDIGSPGVKVGLAEIKVAPDEFALTVEIKSDKEVYQPGENVTMNVEVKDTAGLPVADAELALMVVDVGVLNLTNYQLPDSLSVFYAPYALGVTTTDSRIHLVGQRNYGQKMEEESSGGGQMGNWRSEFVPSAYWNPAVITDASGRAQVNFKLPDNLTKFRMMAVGTSGASRFGSGKNEFHTKKELMVRPALPRFLRVGDTMTAGGVVHNESPSAMDINITGTVEGITQKGEAAKSLNLTPGSVREVTYDYAANESSNATFYFSAKAGDLSDQVQVSLPVSYPVDLETMAVSGVTEDFEKQEFIKPTDLYDSTGGLSVSLSSTNLSGLEQELGNLFDYPFGCLEQKVSRIFPVVLMDRILADFGIEEKKLADYRDRVEDFLATIADYQDYTGGFYYWPGSWSTSPYLTAYVTEFLLLAREANYAVDEAVLKKAEQYMLKILQGQDTTLGDIHWSEKVAMIGALSRLGNLQQSYIDTLTQNWDKLSFYSKANVLELIHRINPTFFQVQPWLDSLLNQVVEAGSTANVAEADQSAWSFYMGSNRMNTASLLQAVLAINPEHPLIPKIANWLVYVKRAKNPWGWENTHETVAVLKAIKDYYDIYEKTEPNFKSMVQRGESVLLEAAFEGRSFGAVRKTLPLKEVLEKELLLFRKEGEGKLFYRAQLDYAKKQERDYPVEEGIVVGRQIETLDGTVLKDQLPLGQTLLVRLNLVFLVDSHFVVVKDPLPAGLEPVNMSLAGNSYEKLARAKNTGVDANWTFADLVNQIEMHNDQVLAFADYVPLGSYEFTYYVRATTPGNFAAPAAKAAEMYNPETYGKSVGTRVVIQ